MELTHDFFQHNMALLQKHHPPAWRAVTDYSGAALGELCLAEDGKPNLLVRPASGEEIFFHDTRDTEAELASYYALVPETATGVAVFIGMGLGYTPPAMLASRAQLRHLVVVEPEMGIFVQALHALDLASLFTDRRVTIAIGPDIDVPALLVPMSRALQLESFYILRHVPCFRFAPELYANMYEEIYKHGNSYNVGGNTTSVYGGKFIANRLQHQSAIHHQQLLEHLKDTFAGMPAIIVAGGPSLNKNIHLLAQAKGRAVIIAADTVLPALLAHGVTPDFTSCIDMQDITLEKIIDVAAEATETSLICSSWLTPAVAKNFPARQIYWSFTAKNMEKWLNNLLGGKILSTGAGTVAQLNFTAAYLLGCSPIVFVGQDLAFTEEQDSHAQHTALTSKDELKGFLDRQEILWVDGYGGGKVPTYRAYLGFKHHFEQSIAAAQDRHFINATEGGVRLEGTEEISLQEVLDRYCGQEFDVAAMARSTEEQAMMPGRRRMLDEFSRLLKAIAGVEKDMAGVDILAAQLTREIAKLQEQGVACRKFDTLPLSLQKQFRELDAINSRLDKAKVWFLLDEATMEGLRISERLKHELDQLADNPGQYLEWLKMAINRFVLISRFRRQVLDPFRQRLQHIYDHLKREDALRKKIAKNGEHEEAVMDLLRLYFASGDHLLMERIISSLGPGAERSPELSFYTGVIAANRCNFAEMERCFNKAVELAPFWGEAITECRTRLALRYLGFYREWHRNDQVVALRMLFKAVRYTTTPTAIRQALAAEATKIVAAGEAASSLVAWYKELMKNSELQAVIGLEQAAAVHRLHGNALLAQEEFTEAAQAFAAAIALVPQDPHLHLLLADAAFAGEDYPTAVAALDRAVALDRNYAVHWEAIGDTLATTGLSVDALAAYEKCFTALPEEIHLLKKIGDCYMAMEQMEAAHEAYRLLKEKIG